MEGLDDSPHILLLPLETEQNTLDRGTHTGRGRRAEAPGTSWVVAAHLIPPRSLPGPAEGPQGGDVGLRVLHHLQRGLE